MGILLLLGVSTANAISVGDATNNVTRQIVGVAAGTADTDAVNVAQLKAGLATVSGAVTAPSVAKGTSGNVTVTTTHDATDGHAIYTVDLANDLNVTSVKTGNTLVNSSGVSISGGSNTVSLTNTGLNNGNNTITNVAAGVNKTDAVNLGQLDERLAAATATATSTVDKGTSGNITVVSSKDEDDGHSVYTVEMSDSGVSITGGKNGAVSLTNTGLSNGNNTITNVANGVNETDAVNVRQLQAGLSASTTTVEKEVVI